jgi:predicted Zn-dependent protease
MPEEEATVTFSKKTLDALYAMAYQHLSSNRFSEGEKLLYSLVMLEPDSTTYWKALGFAQQKQNHFEEACATYAIISSINPDDPEPYLRVAECYFSTGDSKNGLEALHEAEQRLAHAPNLERELNKLKEAWTTR